MGLQLIELTATDLHSTDHPETGLQETDHLELDHPLDLRPQETEDPSIGPITDLFATLKN